MSAIYGRDVSELKFMGLLLEGSVEVTMYGSDQVIDIPLLPRRSFSLDPDDSTPFYDGTPKCTIQRNHDEPITCHVCEGNHHVHILWSKGC